ncbi:type II secretion system F family protein [Halorubrum vacuolatum]|uniref:Archaellum biogenesis protein FlaJ, TadC family n=1 Tax=Halorubrum vacuolatum TaxID=63740 RepID=A0A238X2P1_HALVU|nr:type II secretion system F family protein [Halorubrum vacuolatum]SNR53245.1 Archaellum biogenesis protein FlaJ, TadC family [Halorubrum vacuolatum]
MRIGPMKRRADRGLSLLDRGLYALFARHADERRHALDRKRYPGTGLRTGFDSYLARTYAVSWVVCLLSIVLTLVFVSAVAPTFMPLLDRLAESAAFGRVGTIADVPMLWIAAGTAGVVGVAAKRLTVRLSGRYLRWLAAARRADIERTLPGAVRYLNALAAGTDDARTMVAKAAASDAYGETGVTFRKVVNTTRLTGSLDEGLRRGARETPSRDLLAPFLLKFREHASQGEDALADYLRMESRMLRYRQDRARKRAEGYLELLAELFIVVLVLPALLVIVVTVMGVLAPGLSRLIETPFGTMETRTMIIYGAAGFVLAVGLAGAITVETIRPSDQRVTYRRPSAPVATVRSAARNPKSATVIVLIPALLVGVVASTIVHPVQAALAAYVAFAVPVGGVAVRRARLDDAKDRELKDFIHAVSGHVSLGRPFADAVETVATEVDLGALNEDVADLAFNLSLTNTGTPRPDEAIVLATAGSVFGTDADRRVDRRTAALDRFVERVGTPLARQTVGLVTGALNAGSDADTVFETLQTEVGQLYHEKQALRSAMLVYAVVGWTTALLIVGIVVAVNTQVIDGFAQLSELSGTSGFALDPNAVEPERERFRFYIVTQATMLASGWFAGVASRGPYEALLHSGLLVTCCYAIFAGGGMI